jgi:hypothetical protein
MKKHWRVLCEAAEERVEADELEITASGVLAFFRCASRMEKDRTLLVAFAPGQWRRCQLEGNA